jgi:hypothetical protein
LLLTKFRGVKKEDKKAKEDRRNPPQKKEKRTKKKTKKMKQQMTLLTEVLQMLCLARIGLLVSQHNTSTSLREE